MAQQVFTERYQIERHLARGGMAEVYLARDLLLDRPVALKVLFPEFASDHSFVERFRREARSAANLNHPNIVAVYDWGEDDGTYYIVMEFVDGRTLRDVIRSEGPLHPNRAAEIGADIAGALAFAHRGGVVHRDVKPGNVMISRLVKVTDFGIARASDPQESLTQTGAVMGTATYFSPEQAQGQGIDQRSDVYSLGVVLYEMITGRPPFTGDSPVAIAYQHVRETPVPPSQVNRDVPPAFEAIVLKAMAKNRENRYDSADDLQADLLRFCRGEPVLAGPVLAPAAAATTGMMAATQVQDRAMGTQVISRQTELVEEGPPPPPKRTGTYFVILAVLLALLAGLLFLLSQELGVGNTTEVTVPSVIGKTEAEATRDVLAADLEVEREEVESDDEPGRVIDQDPRASTRVDKGSTVTLRVSKGLPLVAVPDVVGQKEAEATRILEAEGFVVQYERRADDEAEPDTVLEQDPRNTQAPQGTAVTLVVSTGPEAVEVPDVSGEDASDAANILGQAGFRTSQRREADDNVDLGQVIRTEPGPGTPLAKGSTVTLVVSSGPQATIPPPTFPPSTLPPPTTSTPSTTSTTLLGF